MEVSHAGNDTRRLYEAATRGCVASLKNLIQNDQLILNKVSLSSFAETPLHISSLLGHLDFTVALLEKRPKMASEFDSSGRSPLHLASAEGHTEIVKALLSVNKDVCLVRDQDGRIPLHLAAMRGRVEVIQELVRERPESILELLDGDTVLHLCVKYYHLEALKLLMETGDPELIKKQDQDGNTILHLAAVLKQSETIKYIVREVGEKALVNMENKMGFTALNVLEHCPKDIKSYEIRDVLMESVKTRNQKPTSQVSVDRRKTTLVKVWWRNFRRYLEYQGNWIEETRGTLMTVATLIAAMTFQVAVNPPGGVWQQDYTDNKTNLVCGFYPDHCLAGSAMIAYYYDLAYARFLICDTVAFVGSLVVIFLIIGGFPLNNKFCTWLLTVAMSTSIVFAGITYYISIYLVTPNHILNVVEVSKEALILIGCALVFLVSLCHIMRFLDWMHNKNWKWPKSLLIIKNFLKLRPKQQTGLHGNV